jgi:hypothetical protein
VRGLALFAELSEGCVVESGLLSYELKELKMR